VLTFDINIQYACFSQAMSLDLSCDLGDRECRCSRGDTGTASALNLVDAAMTCLRTNCTTADIFDLFKVQAAVCELDSHASNVFSIIGGGIFLALMCLILTVMRITERAYAKSLGWDDVAIGLCGALSIVASAISVKMSLLGWGLHMWSVSPEYFPVMLHLFFSVQTFYPILLGLIKVSVVLFYRPIFPAAWFRLGTTLLMVFIAVTTICTSLLGVFTCRPVVAYWDWDTKPATCLNISVLHVEGAAIGVVQDILIIALPIWEVRKLQMKKSRKVMVCISFALGSLGCLAAIARFVGVVRQKRFVDVTYVESSLTIWSGVELGIAFLCACLPTIRRLLSRWFPRYFGLSTAQSYIQRSTGQRSERSSGNVRGHHITQSLELKTVAFPSPTKNQGRERNIDWDQLSTNSIIHLRREESQAAQQNMNLGETDKNTSGVRGYV
jgi:hypothetical protein